MSEGVLGGNCVINCRSWLSLPQGFAASAEEPGEGQIWSGAGVGLPGRFRPPCTKRCCIWLHDLMFLSGGEGRPHLPGTAFFGEERGDLYDLLSLKWSLMTNPQ